MYSWVSQTNLMPFPSVLRSDRPRGLLESDPIRRAMSKGINQTLNELFGVQIVENDQLIPALYAHAGDIRSDGRGSKLLRQRDRGGGIVSPCKQ
jgi:hypothetical protein